MIFLYVVAGYFVCKWLLRSLCLLCVGLLCRCAVRRHKRLPKSQQPSSTEVRDSHMRQSVVRYLFGMVRLVVYQTARIPSHHIRNLIYRHILCLQMDAETTVYIMERNFGRHGRFALGRGRLSVISVFWTDAMESVSAGM